ncbi:hypothetical protein BC829DRAFT_430810 [Chytridium lagenaria]|nr:hypothetical protein BC829DRAFT_430810 [Chytridium lagenaria]
MISGGVRAVTGVVGAWTPKWRTKTPLPPPPHHGFYDEEYAQRLTNSSANRWDGVFGADATFLGGGCWGKGVCGRWNSDFERGVAEYHPDPPYFSTSAHHHRTPPHHPYDSEAPSDLESIISLDTESHRGSLFDGIDRTDSAYDSDLLNSTHMDSDSVVSRSSSVRSSRGTPFKVAFRYLTCHEVGLVELCQGLYVAAAGGEGGGRDGGEGRIRVTRGRETGEGIDRQVLVALRRDADPGEPVLDDLIAFLSTPPTTPATPRRKLLVSARYENSDSAVASSECDDGGTGDGGVGAEACVDETGDDVCAEWVWWWGGEWGVEIWVSVWEWAGGTENGRACGEFEGGEVPMVEGKGTLGDVVV